VGAPLNGTVDVAGPQQFRFDELIRQGLSARNDPREVVADRNARIRGRARGARVGSCPATRAWRDRLQDGSASLSSSSGNTAATQWSRQDGATDPVGDLLAARSTYTYTLR